MKFLEYISMVSFVLGGVSLVIGTFLYFYFQPSQYVNAFEVFEWGAILLIFFWAIAIGIASYSKYTR